MTKNIISAAMLGCVLTFTLSDAAPAARMKYSVLEETVPYTGVTHLVILTGRSAFPSRTYAEYGDRIMFVNQGSASVSLKASDNRWATGDLYTDDAFVLLVQPGVDTSFSGTAGSSWWSTTISGDFMINQLPTGVDYWGDVRTVPEMLPGFGLPPGLLTAALRTVAVLQAAEGLTNTVLGATYSP